MHYINIGLIFIAGLNVGLAFLIWLRNPKNKINVYFALTILLVAFWSFSMAMFREAESAASAWLWTWIQFISGTLIVVFFFFFSLYFPYQKIKLNNYYKVLIVLSVVVIILVVIIPGIWIKDIIILENDVEYITDRWGLLYANIHVLVYLVLSFYNFISKYRDTAGFAKKQLLILMIATGIIAIFGPFFSTIIPLILAKKSTHWLGPYASLPMLVILSYFIFKKE